jgi:Glycosyltransferase family 10 (fucosyltransferase) C-term
VDIDNSTHKSIKLENFWIGIDTTKEFLISLISLANDSQKPVVVSSVFPKNITLIERVIQSIKYRFTKHLDISYVQRRSYAIVQPSKKIGTKNIWFTGENRRPPQNEGWDAFLSFDVDETIKGNIYLPLWVTRLDSDLKIASSKIDLMTKNRVLKFKKKKFACAFVGNPEPTRLRFINELSKIYQIDLYGSVFKNPVADKHSILKEYNFNICFENDLYPGYVTEKVIESWEAESIPIWWGIDSAGYINETAVINLAELGTAGALKKLDELLLFPERISFMQSQPILKRKFDIDKMVEKLSILLT